MNDIVTNHSAHNHSNALRVVMFTPASRKGNERVAMLELNGVRLPMVFIGDNTDTLREDAMSFYANSLKDREFDFSTLADQDMTRKSVLSLFMKQPLSSVKTRKVADGDDKRHLAKGTEWYVKQGVKPVRITSDQVQKYVDDGYLPGKKWSVAVAKHEGVTSTSNKKSMPGYVNPIQGTILMHKGNEKLRVHADQEKDMIAQGWERGRVKKEKPVDAPQPVTETPENEVASVPAETTEQAPEASNVVQKAA